MGHHIYIYIYVCVCVYRVDQKSLIDFKNQLFFFENFQALNCILIVLQSENKKEEISVKLNKNFEEE